MSPYLPPSKGRGISASVLLSLLTCDLLKTTHSFLPDVSLGRQAFQFGSRVRSTPDDVPMERLAPSDLSDSLIDTSYSRNATPESRAAASGSSVEVPYSSEEAAAIDNYPSFNAPGLPLSRNDALANDFFGRLCCDDDGAASIPSAFGSLSEEARCRLTTSAPEPGFPSFTSVALTEQMADSPNDLAWGIEDGRFGLPVPRTRSEAWRSFDVGSWVGGSPFYDGKLAVEDVPNFTLSPEQVTSLRGALSSAGINMDDSGCSARLVYLDGRYVPAVSLTSSYCHSASSEEDIAHPELFKRLPDGFTDEFAYEDNLTKNGDGVANASGPDHNVGPATERPASNRQMGTAAWAALNTMKARCAAIVDIPDATHIDKNSPVIVVYAYTKTGGTGEVSRKDGVAFHPRTFVVTGRDSSVSMQQQYVDLDVSEDGSTFSFISTKENKEDDNYVPRLSNGFTQIYIGSGSSVSHVYVDESGGYVTPGVEDSKNDAERQIESVRPGASDTHLESIDVHCRGEGSTYSGTAVSIGGSGRRRVCASVTLLKPSAMGELNGFLMAGGVQKSEMRTNIHHVGEATESVQRQKNMVVSFFILKSDNMRTYSLHSYYT
uniref:SUF system FeS cluster assembly SufBD core domain-containing protein n=2 Tax=Corethron hystrix TaxID=216773 RepID=A0A7S1BIY4_9STRA|mmetsp:Transcript_27326/g.62706  ORF Transcript_27326/g.62706 Transcript_27326/m.62706 type:complete len:604 (+) Transcript_27326:254-2065(+)